MPPPNETKCAVVNCTDVVLIVIVAPFACVGRGGRAKGLDQARLADPARRYDAPLQRFRLGVRASLPRNEHQVGIVRPAAAEELRCLRELEDVLTRQI